MPYLFIDDGSPEARDYSSNYIWVDLDDPESLSEARLAAESARRPDRQLHSPPPAALRTTVGAAPARRGRDEPLAS
jgi:hypothetical protein